MLRRCGCWPSILTAAEEQGADIAQLAGTTQNDIIKEYLSRGTYVFPPAAVAPADHRHDRLHGAPRAPVESDQRVQLSPAGGRSDPGAGGGIRAGHRDRSARRGP